MKKWCVEKEWLKVFLIVILIYILPVLLIVWKAIPFYYRFYVLILMYLVTLLLAYIYQFSFIDLGFTKKYLKPSLEKISILTLILTLLIVIYYCLQGSRIDNSLYHWSFYIFFVGVSAPLQEFLYRGFLFAIFVKARLSQWLQVLISSILYSLVHLIYQDVSTLFFTFVMGVIWGIHYMRYRNIYGVIFSHSLLGVVAILLGFV